MKIFLISNSYHLLITSGTTVYQRSKILEYNIILLSIVLMLYIIYSIYLIVLII